MSKGVLSATGNPLSIDNTSITTSNYTWSDWVSGKANNVSIMYKVATLNATSLTITVEGKSTGYDYSASLYTETITAAQTKHKVYNITGIYKELRVGAKIDVTSTPNNFYAGIIRSEE